MHEIHQCPGIITPDPSQDAAHCYAGIASKILDLVSTTYDGQREGYDTLMDGCDAEASDIVRAFAEQCFDAAKELAQGRLDAWREALKAAEAPERARECEAARNAVMELRDAIDKLKTLRSEPV